MIDIKCPQCKKSLATCRQGNSGITSALCSNVVLDDLEKQVKKVGVKDVLAFSEMLPQSSFLYSGRPSNSRERIWACLCKRNKNLDTRSAATVLHQNIAAQNAATDIRLAKQQELEPQFEAAKVSAIEKVKARFQKLAAA